MDANVKKVFEESPWFLATCGDEPHVVPVGFKTITDDGKFAIGAVLLETTLANLRANGKIAIAACVGAEAYQVKEDTFKGAHPAKCAIVVTPTQMIVNSPNADNNKNIAW